MSDSRNYNEYLDELIRYKNNKMSNQERHQFERALERDPFLAEALEGFSEFKTSDLEKDLASIDLISGKRKLRIGKAAYISVAASVAVLVVAFFLFKGLGDKEQVAKLEQPALNQPFAFTDSSFKIMEAEAVASEQDSTEVLLAQAEAFQADKKVSEKRAAVTPVAEKEIADKTTERKVAATKKEELQPSVEIAALKSNQDSGKATASIASAQTQTEHQPELREELVTLENSVAEAPEVENETIDDSKRPGVNAKPQPLGGFDLYKSYIEEHLLYPVSETDGSKEIVKIQFTVTTSGQLTGFSIDKAPDNADFSKEAIRLLRNGPKWAPAVKDGIPVEEVVNYRIVFKPVAK